jgi:hypothetical protein
VSGLAASAGLLAMALVLFMAEFGNKQAAGGREATKTAAGVD